MTFAAQNLAPLITAAKAGSKEALGQVLEHYRPYLRIKAKQLLDSEVIVKMGESALVQETLLSAMKAFPTFRGINEQQLLGWLARILIRRAENLIRQFRGTEKRDVGRERPLSGDVVDPAPGPEQALERAEVKSDRSEIMLRAFYLLSPDYQSIVRLHQQEKRSFVEIAGLMDRSPEAVRKLWTRALRCWAKEAKRLEHGP
jgi:RNA polymerase sigma-70 factor (subfamily 1)